MNKFRKKIRNSLILFTIVFSGNGYAQSYMPLPDSNVLWEDWRQSAQGCDYNKVYIPDSDADTVINGLTYRKLYYHQVTTSGPPPDPGNIYFHDSLYFGAFRQDDSGRVYLRYYYRNFFEQEEVLYMDLTVQQGDTVRQLPCLSTAGQDPLTDLRVDSVDYVSNGPYLRKRIFLRNLAPFFTRVYDLVWIEGIGSVYSGLINVVDNGWSEFYFMKCMSAYDTTFYQGDFLTGGVVNTQGVCVLPYTTAIRKIEPEVPVAVYPLPANDYVIFELNTNDRNGTVTITDLTGRLVTSFPLNGEKTVWDTSGVKPGFYLFRIGNGIAWETGKLLISH
ncbi:MAG: T9SS type A sorting domain-containing protein [Lentimicrobium sp.]|uniref:T9SS type A sorting domain-containing protein n=1 Tax=Lentimicrobium sp. TaxID=2034841 RepID=UPI0025CD27EE|nr:T9SS type A sorting domain-containing protein [Lentimicrobium sp.]MCO5257273.1 T9SS type A sorting domain-containing protein [Lentimicrobium sp.]